MKTIGVLGGMGPQATMDFERRVHDVSTRLIPRQMGAGYPPMVVIYCRHAPLLLEPDGRPRLPPQPEPRLLDAAKRLGAICDFLAIPCNTAHHFQRQIEEAARKPILSMIELTIAEVTRRGYKKVGVLGLGDPRFYTTPLKERGVACETLGDAASMSLRDALDRAIFELMEAREDESSKEAARRAVQELQSRAAVEAIILGCTEIPLLLGEIDGQDGNLINPAQLLAEAAVSSAMS